MTNNYSFFQFGTESQITEQYKKLRAKYHPDKGGTTRQFDELTKAYTKALKQLTKGYLDINNTLYFAQHEFDYLHKEELTNGLIIYTNKNKIYSQLEDQELLENAITTISQLNKKYETIFSECVPTLIKGDTPNFVPVSIKSNFYPLKKVLSIYSFNEEHGAWVFSRLLNLLCMLEAMNLVHGDICIDNLWVDLDNHSLCLATSWHFSQKVKQPFIALPIRSYKLYENKIATTKLDRICAFYTFLNIFKTTCIAELKNKKILQDKFLDFLSFLLYEESSFQIYSKWQILKQKLFDTKRFITFTYDKNKLMSEQYGKL